MKEIRIEQCHARACSRTKILNTECTKLKDSIRATVPQLPFTFCMNNLNKSRAGTDTILKKTCIFLTHVLDELVEKQKAKSCPYALN